MRNQFYADSRDVHKWSVVVQAASRSNRAVYWAAMARADDGPHGNDWSNATNADPKVTAFFSQERNLIKNGQPKDMSRTAILFQQIGIPLTSNLHPYPKGFYARNNYIQQIIQVLAQRPAEMKSVVFLDPDNGLGQSQMCGKQVHEDHFQNLWQNLRVGDALIVIQFQLHIDNWAAKQQEKIARLLQIPVAQVSSFPWANVCLYVAER